MGLRKIADNIFWLGAVDWDRRLFDALIPLPDGTSYNSYLVRGSEKTVLLDTVDPAMADSFMHRLDGMERIDFVVSHHAEQDHSGTIPLVLDRYPEAMVIATSKAKTMLMDLLRIPEERIRAVADGESIDLGGRTLTFLYTSWVHWPETMVTYLVEERILFSGDFFGSHIAASELFVTDQGRVYEAAWFIDAYRDWVTGEPRNTVVLPFVSMHGCTRIMVDHLTEALVGRGVRVELFNLAVTDIGKLAMALVDAATVVVATPTVLAGPHPLAAYAALLANGLRPKARFLSIIGSYGWGGKTVETLVGLVPNIKVEILEPVLCKGTPGADTFAALDRLAESIARKHLEHEFS